MSHSGSPSHASAAVLSAATSTSVDKVKALEDRVSGIEDKLAEILHLLKLSSTAPVQRPTQDAGQQNPTPAADKEPDSPALTAQEAYAMDTLQFTLPSPSAIAVANTLKTRRVYGYSGKLNLFEKPKTIATFPANHFIPEPTGLFGRIKDSNIRDGYEAEVLWNIGHDSEVATAAFHNIAQALQAKDWSAVTEAVSVAYHFHQSAYERVLERVDFFIDALKSGKSEAILLQKYLREEYRPFHNSSRFGSFH